MTRSLVRSAMWASHPMRATVDEPVAAVAMVLLLAATSSAAVFQYAVPVETPRGPREAFLWIPPKAQRVRGVVLGGMTLAEREIAKDPIIRRACAQEQLGIIFLKCGLASADIDRVLADFAESSGYGELTSAPVFLVGHSAGGPQAKSLAIAKASRCFGLMLYRGGVPGGDQAVPTGIPVLMMIGQFDEFGRTMRDEKGRETWEGGRDALAAFRAADERNLASVVVEPGAGHFAWSERDARYLALFLRKAARARIPTYAKENAEKNGMLLEIDHKRGWLTDLNGIKSSARESLRGVRWTMLATETGLLGTSIGKWQRPRSPTTKTNLANRISSSSGPTRTGSMRALGSFSPNSPGSLRAVRCKSIRFLPTSTPLNTMAADPVGSTREGRSAMPILRFALSPSEGPSSQSVRTASRSASTPCRQPVNESV